VPLILFSGALLLSAILFLRIDAATPLIAEAAAVRPGTRNPVPETR
jgi:hypothetical protein